MAKLYLRNSVVNSLCALCILFIASCAAPQKVVKPEPEATPVAKPVVTETIEPAKNLDGQITPQPNVAIILSGNTAPFKKIANALEKHLGEKAMRFTLTGNKRSDQQLVTDIRQANHDQIIAIGSKATQLATQFNDKIIIFCQVYDHQAKPFISERVKGVSAFSSAKELFHDWKQLVPGLNQVLVITGPGLTDYMKDAVKQANKEGIKLIHQVVRTDKEFLYVTKTAPTSIQGQWYFPDNRIISRKALKEALTFNAKEGRQSVVFSPALLSVGGLFYSQASLEAIADQVYQRLQDALGSDYIPGDDMQLLNQHEMGINAVVAKQMGLVVPDKYKKMIYERR